jgi:hypothetical protein
MANRYDRDTWNNGINGLGMDGQRQRSSFYIGDIREMRNGEIDIFSKTIFICRFVTTYRRRGQYVNKSAIR